MQSSVVELFTELVGHGYSIHPLPGRKITWDCRVKVGDLTGLEAGAFVNLVAVPPASAMPRVEAPLYAEASTQDASRSDDAGA